jgi:transposase
MDTHKNASLTPKGREAMTRSVVEGGLSKAVAARQFNTTPKTVAKWVDRFQAEGPAGLMDRSSRPHSSPGQTPPAACAAVEALRRQRHIGAQIAAEVGVSVATVSRILKRLGLNRLSALEPAEPVRRYERVAPGEIIHIDIKKLGKFNRIGHRITGDRTGQSNTRGVGWEYVHLAIDDHSRLAYSEILPDEKRGSCLRFLFKRLALLSKPRRQGRARHDRQRLKLPIPPLRQGPAPAQDQASAHQTLYAQNQWQGRALRPDQLARMGLRARL